MVSGAEILAFMLSVVLLWSGFTKLMAPAPATLTMRRFVSTSTLAQGSTRLWPGLILGGFEIALGLLLAVGTVIVPLRQSVGYLAAFVFAVFALAQLRSLLSGDRFECNCFGAGPLRSHETNGHQCYSDVVGSSGVSKHER